MAIFSIIAAIVSVVAGGVAYAQAAKAAKAAKQNLASGVLLNKNSNNDPIPVIYGTRRVGITRVFVSTQDVANGDPNEFLYICGVVCEGEVESMSAVEIDGVPTTDDRFNYTDSISINYHYGTDAQTVDTLLQEANSDWTTAHRLRGIAYLAIRLKYNPDAFSGIPEITVLVEGKKVYDPRDDTTAFSANPALCIRDYLTNSRYGKGLSTDVIDDDAFGDAADDCDTTVNYWASGDTGPLFECNMVLDTGETIFNNLQKMLLGCRGFLPYRQGEYALIIDGSKSSSFDFTEDHIEGGIQVKGENKQDKANRYLVTFVNPESNWQDDTAIWPDPGSTEETTLQAEDNGTLLQKDIELETITNYYMAREIGRILTQRSRNALRASFKCTSEALQLTVADVVTVTHRTPGWDEKPFQVEEIGLNDDGTCQIQLLEYDGSLYTWDEGAEQRTYPDTNLPNPFSVEAPTGLAVTATARTGPDGSVIPIMTASWTAPDDAFVVSYELQWKQNADSDWFSALTDQVQFEGVGNAVGVLHDIRVRAINTLGVKSAWDGDNVQYTPGGTYSIIASAGVPDPEDPPKAWFWLDPYFGNHQLRIEVSVDLSGYAHPDYLVVCYSYEDAPNQLAILTDSSTKLYLDESNADTGIAGSFSLLADTGSTTEQINIQSFGDIDIDLSGNWWVSVDDGVTATRFYKVHEVTATAILLPPGESLSQTPGNGDTVNIIELDWNDPRDSEYKLAYINGEIIKHNGINYDGNYYLEPVTRGAEGTTEADQSGQTAQYLPAIGPGSHFKIIDMADFYQNGSLYTFSGSLDLQLPARFGWGAISCFFAARTSAQSNVRFVRGNIALFEYKGYP